MIALVDLLFISYFLALNGVYALLISLSAADVLRRKALAMPELDSGVLADLATPPITVLVPAYNEEATVLSSVRSLLQLQYPDLQIIVINDGSRDRTLAVLQEAFGLQPIDLVVRSTLPTAPVRGIYRARDGARLLVVDKENGGKADALNVGLNACRTPLICCLDSDTLIERGALLRMVEPFLYGDEPVAAVGGTVWAINGCQVRGGQVESVDLPRSWWARFQIVEYIRAFSFGRSGLNPLGGPLIISGAFGLFLREAVMAAGGYRHDTVGEDMELVVRLHRWAREGGSGHRIIHHPEPQCFTEVPESYAVLSRQRDRWQRGLADSLWRHRRMMLGWRYGLTGLASFPIFVLFELLGPAFELAGYCWFTYLALSGQLNAQTAILFFLAAYLLGVMINVQSLVTSALAHNFYPRFRQQAVLLLVAAVESLGYRQLTLLFRLRGMINYLRGERAWGSMTRKGFQPPAKEAA